MSRVDIGPDAVLPDAGTLGGVEGQAMKTTFWALLLGLGWIAGALAQPTGGDGIWIDPPGWIGQCFVCPDNQTSDCMDAEPIYIEIEHDRHVRTFHVTQLYPVAWSEETGLEYHGASSLTVRYVKPDEAMATVSVHWLREDGFGVHTVQQIRLHYTAVDVEIMHEHDSFTCH